MTPSLYDEVVETLRGRRIAELRKIGLAAGVGATFCEKLVSGQRPNPRWQNLKAVADEIGIVHRPAPRRNRVAA